MKMTFGRFKEIGERGYNLERVFNVKRGVTRADDALPERLTNQPQDPKVPKSKVPLEALKKDYYKIRGWDVKWLPKKEKLVQARHRGGGLTDDQRYGYSARSERRWAWTQSKLMHLKQGQSMSF